MKLLSVVVRKPTNMRALHGWTWVCAGPCCMLALSPGCFWHAERRAEGLRTQILLMDEFLHHLGALD